MRRFVPGVERNSNRTIGNLRIPTVTVHDYFGRHPRWIGLTVGVLTAIALTSAAWGPLYLPTVICRGYEEILSDFQGLDVEKAPPVGYDEQDTLTEVINTTSLQTTVRPTQSSDADGYGPAYLLNGLTNRGYWYQTGVSFSWGRGDGHVSGPTFLYEVFGISGYSIAQGMERVQIASDDNVQLSLALVDGNVVMGLSDSRTCTVIDAQYSAFGATNFGNNSTGAMKGFYNGLLTEWWHAGPYRGPTGHAVYTIPHFATSAATISIGELVPNSNPNATFECNLIVNLAAIAPQLLPCENATAEVDDGTFATG